MKVFELIEKLQDCDLHAEVQIKGREITKVSVKSTGPVVRITLVETPCEAKECSYYTHYLPNYYPTEGFEKLGHLAFHGAEKNCEVAQLRCKEWTDNSLNDNKPLPEHLVEQATYWEQRVCA